MLALHDTLAPLPLAARPLRPAAGRRRHSISTSTLPHSPVKMADAAASSSSTGRSLLRPPSTAKLTLPMPTPSGPSPTTRKIAAELRRHSFRMPATSVAKSTSSTSFVPTTMAAPSARSPVKVLSTASSTAVRIQSHPTAALKSAPATTHSSTRSTLPILRFQYVARDVRVSVGSSWKLPRADRKHLRLTTEGSPDPFLTVFCATTTNNFVLPRDTTAELSHDQLKLKSSSDATLRLKMRFATPADAAIWKKLVVDAVAHAAWRFDHEDVACLAQDAVSRVVVARARGTKTEFVVKSLLRKRVDEPLTEIAVLRKLVPLAATHASLAFLREYRIVETARDVQLIMPRHAGHTLLTHLSASGPTKSLRETEARRVVAQICETLHVLHANGIVHCDLKLENVLVTDHAREVCVIDFGGAYDRDAARKSNAPAVMVGTPGYIAPERILCVDAAPTPAADLFSLGVLLYQMLVGQHPYANAQAARRRLTIDDSLALDWTHMERRLRERNVSPEAQELLAQLVAADPSERITLEQLVNHAWLTNQAV